MSHFLLSIVLILFGSVMPVFLIRFAGFAKTTAVLSISAGCLLGLINAAAILMSPTAETISFQFLKILTLTIRIDPFSSFFLILIFAVSMLSAIYSYNYISDEISKKRGLTHYLFFGLLICSMAFVATAGNIISFMLAWEIMSLSSYFLVVYDFHKPENLKAGFLYLVFSHVGAMFILAAFGLVYGYSGSFEFSSLSSLPETIKLLIFILAFIGFGSKAGIFPFHVWLPHAHPAAPSHISAVMSGVMIKIGIYGIIKIYFLLNFHSMVIACIVLGTGVISGILGIVYALGQDNLKKLLAYSSVENIGIILIGIGIGMVGLCSDRIMIAALGFTGGFFHILNHSIFKSLLFLGAGAILKKTGSHSVNALGGLLKSMRVTGTMIFIGSLSICGIPPLNGFVGEFLIYIGAFKGIHLDSFVFVICTLSIISLAVIGGLALACFTKVIGVVLLGEPRTEAACHTNEKGPAMLIPMVILATACLFIGVAPGYIIQLPVNAVASLGLEFSSTLFGSFKMMTTKLSLGASILLSTFLFTALIRIFFYKDKTISKSGTWGCGFTQPTVKMQYTGTSYTSFILDFFRPVAPVSETAEKIEGRFPLKTNYKSQVNDIAELNMPRFIVQPVFFIFDRLRWIQHGDIHLYIGYILLTIVLLLFFI